MIDRLRLRWVSSLRGYVYKKGYRPKFGSILFSPSLDLLYGFRDADIAGAFSKGLEQGSRINQNWEGK